MPSHHAAAGTAALQHRISVASVGTEGAPQKDSVSWTCECWEWTQKALFWPTVLPATARSVLWSVPTYLPQTCSNVALLEQGLAQADPQVPACWPQSLAFCFGAEPPSPSADTGAVPTSQASYWPWPCPWRPAWAPWFWRAAGPPACSEISFFFLFLIFASAQGWLSPCQSWSCPWGSCCHPSCLGPLLITHSTASSILFLANLPANRFSVSSLSLLFLPFEFRVFDHFCGIAALFQNFVWTVQFLFSLGKFNGLFFSF